MSTLNYLLSLKYTGYSIKTLTFFGKKIIFLESVSSEQNSYFSHYYITPVKRD